MSLSTEIVTDLTKLSSLASAWDALVSEDSATARGSDATTGSIWFATLIQAFDQARTARIVVVREHDRIVALLPLIAEPGHFGCRSLYVATELYGGRNGFLLERQDPALLAALLSGVTQAFGKWESIRLMIVDESPSEALLRAVLPSLGMRTVETAGWCSPFFPLMDDADDFNAGVSKGVRQTIRTAMNKLKPLGTVHVVEIAGEAMAQPAIDAILEVDRASWKHSAGTAITRIPSQERFYRALFPEALRAGLLYGQLLHLDATPLAFNFGLVREGVYSCLKQSQRAEHETLGLGQVLNARLIESLRKRGIRTYDYMGTLEPYKLRWAKTTGTYARHPVRIYNVGLCGRAGYLVHKVKRLARDRLRRGAASEHESAEASGAEPRSPEAAG